MSGDGAERYAIKRAAGVSPVRQDGSRYSPEVDRISAAAEEWFADLIGGILDNASPECTGIAGMT